MEGDREARNSLMTCTKGHQDHPTVFEPTVLRKLGLDSTHIICKNSLKMNKDINV